MDDKAMGTARKVEQGGAATSLWLGSSLVVAAKVASVAAFFLVCSFVYGVINEWAIHSTRTKYFRSPRDAFPAVIQPWTAVVYVFGGYAAPMLPFFYHWSWPRLRFVLQTYLLASLMMFAVFLIFPVGMHRPEYAGVSLGERLMLGVFAVDRETNCFPSGHIVFAILPAILVSRGGAGRLVRVGVWVLAAAICVSTVTTGQHYYADVVAGALTAVSGFLVSLACDRFWAPRAFARGPG
jgi:membrane-associated phospholipid phosphatase